MIERLTDLIGGERRGCVVLLLPGGDGGFGGGEVALDLLGGDDIGAVTGQPTEWIVQRGSFD